jgi:transcriptional regulator with XRE-family HTH domain
MNTNYSTRIREILKTKDLSVIDFCRLIGLNTPTTIHLIIKENRKPSTKTVDRIMEAFPEVTKDWLLYGKGSLNNNVSEYYTKLTPSASQVIQFLKIQQSEMEMRLAEYEAKVVHLMTDKIESEVGDLKEITKSNSLKTDDIADRLEKMERFIFLANQETKEKSKKTT